jgi:hypothetical protein
MAAPSSGSGFAALRIVAATGHVLLSDESGTGHLFAPCTQSESIEQHPKRELRCDFMRVIVRIIRRRPWVGAAVCSAIAITVLCWFHLSTARPDKKTVLATEDEVYEVVVRDMVMPTQGQPKISQLIFDEMLQSNLATGTDVKSCKERARENLGLENNTQPEFNSVADKTYRLFTRGWFDSSLRADTIQDFIAKSCTAGHLSRTFHTDLPRSFIGPESVHFHSWPIEKDDSTSFEQLFPGASGIISFSHVGFDSTFHEAVVSSSFVCGGLCGVGQTYVLKKTWGRWQVANKWVVWVS